MTGDEKADNRDLEADPTYRQLLELDALESLLEEIEELPAGAEPGPDLRQRLYEVGVADQRGLRQRIDQLHVMLDAQEPDEGSGAAS